MRRFLPFAIMILLIQTACGPSTPVEQQGPAVLPSAAPTEPALPLEPAVPAEMVANWEKARGAGTVEFKTLLTSHPYSIFGLAATNKVFTSQSDMATFFDRPESLPVVDFDHFVAVLVAFGQKHTGAIQGEIVAIEEQDERLVVHAVLWMPPPLAGVSADIGWPYHLVAVPKRDKPIEFAPVIEVDWRLRPSPGTR